MHVAVIGGGYAGLSAAAMLAARGVPVTLYEAAKQLGGRARRVEHNGTELDNGQHILLGAYHETLRLLQLVGVDRRVALLELPLEIVVPGSFKFKTAPLPAPLHLLFGLLGASGLEISTRIQALRFMLGQRRRRFQLSVDRSVSSLLQHYRQPDSIRRFLWEPLCLAALNTPIENASAQIFLNVLRDGLNGKRSDSGMLLPRTDLSRLFPDHAAAYLAARNGKVLLSHPVQAIVPAEKGFLLKSRGEDAHFTHVVCAVPPSALAPLTADLPELAETARMVAAYGYQPIYTIYLQYPRQTTLPRPMLGMHGGLAQWVFDRGRINGQPGLLAAVISAAGEHQQISRDELAQRIHQELAREHRLPAPLWHQVIAEKRATFACTAGIERPQQRTPLRNFYLAGDYTAGEYPATIEAAVRSGVKCAHHILETI